jgi:hypothetical protein
MSSRPGTGSLFGKWIYAVVDENGIPDMRCVMRAPCCHPAGIYAIVDENNTLQMMCGIINIYNKIFVHFVFFVVKKYLSQS